MKCIITLKKPGGGLYTSLSSASLIRAALGGLRTKIRKPHMEDVGAFQLVRVLRNFLEDWTHIQICVIGFMEEKATGRHLTYVRNVLDLAIMD